MLFYIDFDKKIRGIVMIRKRKIILITTFIIITALLLVLCVGLLTGNEPKEFDGTLVESNILHECRS